MVYLLDILNVSQYNPKISWNFHADDVPKIVTLSGGLMLFIHLVNPIKDTYDTFRLGLVRILLLFLGIFWFFACYYRN